MNYSFKIKIIDFHAWMCGEARGALGFIEGALVSSVLSTHSE